MQICLIRGSSEYVPPRIGHPLPARAGFWHLNQTSPRVGCGGRLVGACRIDFLLFPLALPWRWLEATPKAPGLRQRKEKNKASGTSNEVSAKPNTQEPDDHKGGGLRELVGDLSTRQHRFRPLPYLSELARWCKFAPTFFLLDRALTSHHHGRVPRSSERPSR